ncbi:MAG: hypothetical protein WDN09_00230 [bacterium]
MLRILSNLGYIGGNETLMNLIRSPLEMALMQEVSKQRVSVLSLINKTLKENSSLIYGTIISCRPMKAIRTN